MPWVSTAHPLRPRTPRGRWRAASGSDLVPEFSGHLPIHGWVGSSRLLHSSAPSGCRLLGDGLLQPSEAATVTGGAWEGEGRAWGGRGGAAGGTCPESRRLSLKPESRWPGGRVYGGGSDGWTCDWPCPWSGSQTHAVN